MASGAGADSSRLCPAAGDAEWLLDGVPCSVRGRCRSRIRSTRFRHRIMCLLRMAISRPAKIHSTSPLDVAVLSPVVFGRRAAADRWPVHRDGCRSRLDISPDRVDKLVGSAGDLRSVSDILQAEPFPILKTPPVDGDTHLTGR